MQASNVTSLCHPPLRLIILVIPVTCQISGRSFAALWISFARSGSRLPCSHRVLGTTKQRKSWAKAPSKRCNARSRWPSPATTRPRPRRHPKETAWIVVGVTASSTTRGRTKSITNLEITTWPLPVSSWPSHETPPSLLPCYL